SVEVESVGRRQIEIAVTDVWRERRATNLDGRHVVRPFSTGFALDHPAVDSLDGQRLSRNSRDQIPTARFSIAVSPASVRIFVPRRKHPLVSAVWPLLPPARGQPWPPARAIFVAPRVAATIVEARI